MEFTVWISFAAICALGAMSPGPSLAVVLRYSVNSGASYGVVAAISHGFGVGLYACLAVLGLGSLITQFPTVYSVMLYVGAAYLLYLAYLSIRSSASPTEIETSDTNIQNSVFQAARDGFSIAFLNPKLAIFFTALFSQFINPDNMSFFVGSIMVLTVFTIDTVWYFIIAHVTSRSSSREFLTRHSTVVNRLIGVFFIALALRVIFQ